jgi:peptidyl-prolyl cis-trans isomerase D
MVNLMRKYQQTLLLIVTILVIIAFAWLYNDYKMGSSREDAVGRVYEKPVRLGEYHRGAKRLQVAQELGMYELIGGLAGDARSMEALQPNFVFGTYVLRHEADALGLKPTSAEILEAIKKLPPFQTNGVFDPNKYNMYVQRIASFGFTAEQIEEAAADSLRVEKLKKLLSATIYAAPTEVRHAYEENNQKQEVSFVRVKEEEIAKEINVTEEDVKKAFEERKESFKTDELRKVKFVSFLLSEEEKKLQGKERGTVLQGLLNQVNDFAVALTEKDAKFEEVAQKANRPVAETPEFPVSKPPKELNESRAAAQAAFNPKLTLEQPISDIVTSEKRDGYYVLQLTGITPPRPRTYEEVKEELTATLKQERTAELLNTRAGELRTKLDAELKAGKSFTDAAQAVGLTAESLPAFSQAEPVDPKVAGGGEISRIAADLAVGELSEAAPVQGGRVICRVEKRLPIEEEKFEKEKTSLAERIAEGRAESAFRIWFSERMKAANLQTSAVL